MTTSGAGPWFPRLADLVDDAIELGIGIDLAKASERHLSSALRSYNRKLIELDNQGNVISRDEQRETTLIQNQATFIVEADTLAVNDMNVRINGHDHIVTQRSFHEWRRQTNKAQTGRPTTFTLHYGRPHDLYMDIDDASGNPVTPTVPYGGNAFGVTNWGGANFIENDAYNQEEAGLMVILWPIPDQQYSVNFSVTRLTQEGCTLGEQMDVRRSWLNFVTYGVAADLALKFKTERYPALKAEEGSHLKMAQMENRSRSDFVVGATGFDFSFRKRSRRRRR